MAACKWTALLLAVLVPLSCAKPPPGYVKKPDNDLTNAKYEFAYSVRSGTPASRQGHAEARLGERTHGAYFVRTRTGAVGGTEQSVRYEADEWGYHPLVAFSQRSPHAAHGQQFALGERAVAALRRQQAKGVTSQSDLLSQSLHPFPSGADQEGDAPAESKSAPGPQALALAAGQRAEVVAEVKATLAGLQSSLLQQGNELAPSGPKGSFRTTVGQPVSNLLVRLPQVTYQTSFDADGSAVTYTQGPELLYTPAAAHIHSSQSGHYHFESSNSAQTQSQASDSGALHSPEDVSAIPQSSSGPQANSESSGGLQLASQASSELQLASQASSGLQVPSVSSSGLQLASHDSSGLQLTSHDSTGLQRDSQASSGLQLTSQSSSDVSSTPEKNQYYETPSPAAVSTSKLLQESSYSGEVSSYANQGFVSSTPSVDNHDSSLGLNLIPQRQSGVSSSGSNYEEGTTSYEDDKTSFDDLQSNGYEVNGFSQNQNQNGESYSESQNNYAQTEKNGVVHLKFSSKNNHQGGSSFVDEPTSSQSDPSQVGPTVPTPVYTQQATYVTATGGGKNNHGSYTVTIKDNNQSSKKDQDNHFVQISSYGGESNAALEFGAKIKPGFRVKVIASATPIDPHDSVQKEYVRFNEVQSEEKIVTQTPTTRSSFKPIIVADLEPNEDLTIVTPKPSVEPIHSNPEVVYSETSYSQHSSSVEVSESTSQVDTQITTVRPVVVTPESSFSTSPSESPEIEGKEVLITPRPDSVAAASSSKESADKISVTLPRVNSQNPRRFKNKFGQRTSKIAIQTSATSVSPSTTPTPSISFEPEVPTNPEGDRPKTFVEIQKAVPYELPVQDVYIQSSNSGQVYVPSRDLIPPFQQTDQPQIIYGNRYVETQQEENGSEQVSDNRETELDGSKLLLATLLDEHRTNDQASPNTHQYRTQTDGLNPEFLNQIQIANAQTLLQAVQYETLRGTNQQPKEKTENPQLNRDVNQLQALPLVSHDSSEQSISDGHNYVIQKPTNIETSNQQTYLDNNEGSNIFDIAKRIKQEQDRLLLQSQDNGDRKIQIQTLLQVAPQGIPSKQVAVKEVYTKEQIENLQKDFQSSYEKYLSDINKQVAQSQQYFGLLAQQPLTFTDNSPPQRGQSMVGLQDQQPLTFTDNSPLQRGQSTVGLQDQQPLTFTDNSPLQRGQSTVGLQDQQPLTFTDNSPPKRGQSTVGLQDQGRSQVQHLQVQNLQVQTQKAPQNFLQQLLQSEIQPAGAGVVNNANEEPAKDEGQEEVRASGSIPQPSKVLPVEKSPVGARTNFLSPPPPPQAVQVGAGPGAGAGAGAEVVEVERPVPYPQPVAVPYPVAVAHPVEVPVHHVLAVPHYVQVPVKEYHPVLVAAKGPHKVAAGPHGPSPMGVGPLGHLTLAYSFPHKDNLHRALLKQHADAAPYGLGRYAAVSPSARRPFPAPHPHPHPHPHHPHFRPHPPPPPPPPQRGARLRHLRIEYGGFRPPLVPSRQIEGDATDATEGNGRRGKAADNELLTIP